MKPNKLTPGSNLLWESSRMMLPEHVERIREHKKEQLKVKKPILDEQELEEINRTIMESIAIDRAVTITYADKHEGKEFWGWVTKVHHQDKWLKIKNDEGYLILPFKKIISAEIT